MCCWFEDIKELTADISPASAGTLLHANLLMSAGGLHGVPSVERKYSRI